MKHISELLPNNIKLLKDLEIGDKIYYSRIFNGIVTNDGDINIKNAEYIVTSKNKNDNGVLVKFRNKNNGFAANHYFPKNKPYDDDTEELVGDITKADTSTYIFYSKLLKTYFLYSTDYDELKKYLQLYTK